jgi:hypothetical protein
METKICTNCKLNKTLEDFHNYKLSKDGKKPICKLCNNKKANEYKLNNIEAYKITHKINNERYRKANKEKIDLSNKQYRENNKDVRKLSREKYKTKRNENHKSKIKTDPLYRLKCNIRGLIKKNFLNIKKSKKTEEILGCSFEQFKEHLESKFESWMNWDNRGLYNGTEGYGWDIDHIIPSSSAITEDDVIRLNHFSNLQPLCSHINRNIKKDRY